MKNKEIGITEELIGVLSQDYDEKILKRERLNRDDKNSVSDHRTEMKETVGALAE